MKDKAAHREYMREWVRKRRAEYMRDKSCVDCGSRERLEIDHVDPETKVSHRIWSWAAARRDAELAKCVVRCRPCHERKSIAERKPHTRPLKPCGTDAAYKRGCRCPECRAAHAVAWKPVREPWVPRPAPPKTNAARWVEQGMRRLARKTAGDDLPYMSPTDPR